MDEQKHKYRCMVRQLIKWRKEWGLRTFREYIHKHNFDWQLIKDFEDQWLKGNRADEKGEWK